MTLLGTDIHCDSCGEDVGNGSVTNCVVVSDLVRETGMVRNLHFCRQYDEAKGKDTGCSVKLLRPAILKHLTDSEAEG